ncbi:MAG: quinolinate synthase NadA [Dehalococcoidia bacterium]
MTQPTSEELLLAEAMECTTDRPLQTVPLVQDTGFAFWQHDIPIEYCTLTADELAQRVQAAKAKLSERLVILGHHYQREDIIQFADYRGDSLKLARWAAEQRDRQYIVFCGVHFMAETADILSDPQQIVILPNMAAGCSMADMAAPHDVHACWDELTAAGITAILPVTYINSAASLKAFCGHHDGIICTSSNARMVLKWALQRAERVLFFPDQHLGRNTAVKLGIPLEEMALWDYTLPPGSLGGTTLEEFQRARIILWKGHCAVHQRFTVEQIRAARLKHPDIQVIVHPECTLDVVQAADYDGSTEFIARTIAEAPPGSKWAVGTEINLVTRLARENPDKLVFCLDPVVCPCATMYRIHPAYLCWVLEELVEGRVVNRVQVDAETARHAKIALDRMLAAV